MKKGLGCVLLGVMMFAGSAHSFIYEIVVLKRINPVSRKIQHFIGLSDFHDKKNLANAAQLLCIKDFLHNQNKSRTKIILEDLSTDSNNGKYGVCRQFRINSRGGILGGLAHSCHQKGLLVDNIEYRYCRVAALGPLLNNEHQKIHDFPSARGVKVCDIAHEIHNAITDIGAHTSCCAALSAYREKILKRVEPAMNMLYLLKDSKHSVADYVQQHSRTANRFELLKQLLIFDSPLLDLKLARSILTADKCDTIIAIAGGSHITRVKEMLQSAGYQLIYNLPGKGIKNPKPINLSFLKNLGFNLSRTTNASSKPTKIGSTP